MNRIFIVLRIITLGNRRYLRVSVDIEFVTNGHAGELGDVLNK